MLKKNLPKLKIIYSNSNVSVDKDGNSESLDIPKLDILFVAFGQVKQEKWIDKNKDRFDVKIFMGVGGAFDYLSGQVTRAPLFLRRIGLEWLFRLVLQPWRIKRFWALLEFLTHFNPLT